MTSPTPQLLPAKPEHASAWPKWLRRGPLEMAACGVISLGLFMLLQPFFLGLYTWSFVTMLGGTVMFMVVSKFPD
jgi:hypothetical protein